MAQTKDIAVEQGSSVKLVFNVQVLTDELQPESSTNPLIPFDLVSQNLRMQVRRSFNSEVLIDATTANGKVELIAPSTNGQFQVLLDASETEEISFHDESLECVYDIEMFDNASPSNVVKVSKGKFVIHREVTR